MKALRFLLFLLNVLFAVALVLSYITRYINPQFIWHLEFISLGYPIYIICNSFFVIFWLLGKNKKYATLSIITLLLGFSTFIDTVAFNTKTPDAIPEDKTSLTVVSYNVMAFNWDGWKNRANIQSQVMEYLHEQSPDILCLQEFHHDSKEKYRILDTIKRKLGLRYVHSSKVHEIKGRYFYGNIIFSRYPIIKTGVYLYQKTGNTTIWADIVVKNDTIRVYNNHLESYRLHSAQIETIEQTAAIKEFESRKLRAVAGKLKRAIQKRGSQVYELDQSIRECPYSVIVCGDFNSPPYSFTYHTLKSSKSLNDVFLEKGFGFGGTLNWHLPSKRLDFILVSPRFEVYDYERKKLKLSDHFPLQTVLLVQPDVTESLGQ